MPTKFLQIQTTTDDENVARTIARQLVENQLAACVQLIKPIISHYRWEGQFTTSPEWLLLIKTTATKYPLVEQTILKLHNYQLPEIIALPIVNGTEAYLNWLAAECR